MWSRVLHATDFLIKLLKTGGLWEHSLIAIVTEFGRDKARATAGTGFGTGHHLNNGVTLISPMLHGGKVYGGVDPTTLLTRKWDWATDKPVEITPGQAPTTEQVWREGDIYGAITRVLDIETSDGVKNAEFDGLKKT